MREILFRGKMGKGAWIYGCYVLTPDVGPVIVTCADWGGKFSHPVIPTTVGQFTGLYDKNGKKIFEGDIVDIWSAGQHCYGLVKWGQGSVSFFVEVPCTPHIWHLSGGGKNYDEETCEVIGNIHDNPELLKEESE